MNLQKPLLWFVKAVLASIIATGILSLFTLVYSNTGVHIANPTHATDYTWEPNQVKATMTEGFAWFRMDEHGFNNALNERRNEQIDILLMGSSHMEAVSIPADQNVGYLLNEMMPQLNTYNIGMSGHVLYNCVNNMEDAVEAYHPTKYVCLNTNTVEPDMESMRQVIDGTFQRIVSYDNGLLYTVQKSIPAIKVLYKKAEEWVTAGAPQQADAAPDEISEVDFKSPQYRQILTEFLEKAEKPVRASGAKLIIFYHPEVALNAEGELTFGTSREALAAFQRACEDENIIFVDTTEDFVKLYDEEHKLPYGFINTEVGKGHLNVSGHKAVAERLQNVIMQLEQG